MKNIYSSFYSSKLVVLFTGILIVLSGHTYASDDNGKFAAKGAGTRTCEAFIADAAERSSDYLLYGGWVEGYLSAYNRFNANTYDITPWQTTELMLVLLNRHCTENPKKAFLQAVNTMLKTLDPIKLENESKIIKIELNGAESYYYTDIIIRVKERLSQLGLYEGDTTSPNFAIAENQAILKFQESIGLQQTGVPDQQTMVSLFLKRVE